MSGVSRSGLPPIPSVVTVPSMPSDFSMPSGLSIPSVITIPPINVPSVISIHQMPSATGLTGASVAAGGAGGESGDPGYSNVSVKVGDSSESKSHLPHTSIIAIVAIVLWCAFVAACAAVAVVCVIRRRRRRRRCALANQSMASVPANGPFDFSKTTSPVGRDSSGSAPPPPETPSAYDSQYSVFPSPLSNPGVGDTRPHLPSYQSTVSPLQTPHSRHEVHGHSSRFEAEGDCQQAQELHSQGCRPRVSGVYELPCDQKK